MNVALPSPELPAIQCLSLCSGVGGLELGIRLALQFGWGLPLRGICYVEREASAAASLAAKMEQGRLHPAPVWSDLATFDGGPWRGHVHILASGDPCQDNSVAGNRAGADGERFLAPEVCRIAAECRPDLIFRENVPGNAEEQLEALCPPLERLGYRIEAGIFSSRETGNTMPRERLFFLASASSAGSQGHKLSRASGSEQWLPASGSTAQLRGARLPAAVIPGPADTGGWIDLLDRYPEFQPALSEEEAQSHLRRGIDAMADRVERLRHTGNGVDPVAAAYAFLSLHARLCEARGGAGRASGTVLKGAA